MGGVLATNIQISCWHAKLPHLNKNKNCSTWFSWIISFSTRCTDWDLTADLSRVCSNCFDRSNLDAWVLKETLGEFKDSGITLFLGTLLYFANSCDKYTFLLLWFVSTSGTIINDININTFEEYSHTDTCLYKNWN